MVNAKYGTMDKQILNITVYNYEILRINYKIYMRVAI